MTDNKLYLDDIRNPKSSEFKIVRSYEEAIDYVKAHGIPKYISFDHDLGCTESGKLLPSGHDFAKWLVEMDIEKLHTFPSDFKFNVHSANPIGRNNIQALLNNYLLFRINHMFKKIVK